MLNRFLCVFCAFCLLSTIVACSSLNEKSEEAEATGGDENARWQNALGASRYHEMALIEATDATPAVVIMRPIRYGRLWRTIYFHADEQQAIVTGAMQGRCQGKVMAPEKLLDVAWRIQKDICQGKTIRYVRGRLDHIRFYMAKGVIENGNAAPAG